MIMITTAATMLHLCYTTLRCIALRSTPVHYNININFNYKCHFHYTYNYTTLQLHYDSNSNSITLH